jgi:hypothetical protein
MSLWLQSAIEHFHSRHYQEFRENLLPRAPSPMPECLIKELEFGESYCTDPEDDPLFPIRYLWLLEGLEQRNFNLPMMGRSRFHPEILLYDIWERVNAEPTFRQELESAGFKFNFHEKAIAMSTGWVLIGDHFTEDFFEIESILNIKLLFPEKDTGELKTVFNSLRKR